MSRRVGMCGAQRAGPSGPASSEPGSRAQYWSAEAQAGVISRAQALRLGMTGEMIAWRLQRGHWQRLHRGIYATFSGRPGRSSYLWAAVLRAGSDSMLSHQTAAELAGLTTRQSAHIHVTVPRGSPVAPIAGVVLHYSGRARAACHPVLTPPRTRVEETVLDLVQTAPNLEDALSWVLSACASRRTTAARLSEAIQLRQRMRWHTELATALADAGLGVHSLLEYRYLNGVERAHGLPAGIRQWRTRRASRSEYADVAYEGYQTLVELDGRTTHPEHARWRDIRRDNAHAADGRATLRYGWIEVSQDSCRVAQEVADVLRRHGWDGRLRRCGRCCRIESGPVAGSAGGG